jgi:predicted O-linked N-acetylglucosamine transferase (SPINDLY family)
MALALPVPARPGASRDQARAHRRWQAGQALAAREQWRLAALEFEQASGLHGDQAYGLAAVHALIKADRSADAVERARAMRAAHPDLALAYTLESHALLDLGHAAAAVDTLSALPLSLPRDHDHLVSLAVALQRSRRHEEAIRVFFQALALKMDDAPSHFRLGMSFKDLGLKAEAAECVRTAVTLGLDTSELAARGQLVFLEREACRWAAAADAMAGLRTALAAVPDLQPCETAAFPSAVLSDDPHETLKAARHYALHVQRGYPALPRRPARAHDGRLRIGYLSADFHHHATTQLMAQMLESHDRSAFDVTLFSAGPDDGSAMRQRIVAACEHFVELRGQSFPAMARCVREAEIDILIDLKGATYDTLLPVLAMRPAPLQATWLGFPGSTGAPYVDYLIGDETVTPLAHADRFAEKIAQLPRCYQPNDARRALPRPTRRADWGAGEDSLLLCAFHQSYKISAPVFDTWCRMLKDLPGSVLWLLQWNANVRATLTAAAAARGIGEDRLLFAPLLPVADHLARLAHADLFLDTWPCNAHTTAGEALWCAVPVITIEGETFAQRVAPSLLRSVELAELVCRDADAYARLATSLARDPVRRAALRSHLERQRTSSPLFDGESFARDIESLYRRMWGRAVSGLAPEALPAAR